MKSTTLNISTKISAKATLLIALLLCFFGVRNTTFAQPSLAAENVINDISVTTALGKRKTYTVFQDAAVREQWYYMPNELRVAEERDVNNKVRPKMTILRYQYEDMMTKELKEGGVLVATFTYAMEPEVVETVKQQIRRNTGIGNIRLSAMPLKDASINFLADSDKFLADIDAKTEFKGATSASQEIPVFYDLTVLGASSFKALVSSNGGIPIRANITYNGLSPDCGYSIEGNWNNVYDYFEKNTKKEAGVKIWFVKAGGIKTKQELREELNKIQDMKVEVMPCEGPDSLNALDNANLTAMMKTIREAVYSDSLLDRASELESLKSMLVNNSVDDTTKARILDMITEGGKSLKLGYQQDTKKVKRKNSGKLSFDFTQRRMLMRETSFGGLLSFSKYGLTEEQLLSDGYIIDIDVNSDFPSVVMGLPHINPDLNLNALILEVSYRNSDGTIHSQARKWDSITQKWATPMGKQIDYLRFNMIGEKNKSRAGTPTFEMKLQVVSAVPNASFTIEKQVQLNQGERFPDALELLTDHIIVDGSILDFGKITNNDEDLALAKLELQRGELTIRKSIKPYFINASAAPPSPVHILLPKTGLPTAGKVTYFRKTGPTKSVVDAMPVQLGENTLLGPDWPDAGDQ
ncbi:hypothetical protein [Flavilitoribacter nigricans]|uniref:Uncharacterized protein n=1 Tax=Flavilitoribacter nigricans (strain ATCC 23147 / DSM 23189 / NBRC 102662 / NCIMB 1420 / SS-2) TaxID=1122177 RepID=A0A2D0MZ77_FLAN2|nr:hypothetical protein [Flavilitoribacter nigricans]PHN01581.1 hypothetical protein CRP01_36390 [Flavilitoribacter nigricans DSM 23189 = NBRC 102662]